MASLTTVTSQFHQHHVVSEPESLFIPKRSGCLDFFRFKKDPLLLSLENSDIVGTRITALWSYPSAELQETWSQSPAA